jgi:hypothetical protein
VLAGQKRDRQRERGDGALDHSRQRCTAAQQAK